MFIDFVEIEVKGGDGGNGAVSFCRDRITSRGGPDGGNGGKGGDIVFVTSSHLSTLSSFKNKKKFFAQNGKDGSSRKRSGKQGEDLVIKVPCGTIIKNSLNEDILCDMCTDGMVFTCAKGGRGGAGNINFKSSVNRTPKFAKEGKPGEYFKLILELKLIADVGLIGMPNAGKSTIISSVSNANSKIGNYPFTTLSPVLGVVNMFDKSFVIADIPGLVKGASSGVGLGHEFLKHIQRCKMLVHVVDISSEDPINDFLSINKELEQFDKKLLDIPILVAANKIDISTEEKILEFRKFAKKNRFEVFEISAISGKSSLTKLMNKILSIMQHSITHQNM